MVKDNKVNQLAIKSMLNKLKYNVDIANNGREAVEKSNQKQYDLIFMDIEMTEMSKLLYTHIYVFSGNIRVNNMIFGDKTNGQKQILNFV